MTFVAVLLLFVLWTPASNAKLPAIGKCNIFPANNAWNIPVDKLPVHRRSAAWIAKIGNDVGTHPDFGSGEG